MSTSHTQQQTETVRAWDLREGDVLSPVGFTINKVTVDPPGHGGRQVHFTADILGAKTIPLNQPVTIQKRDAR